MTEATGIQKAAVFVERITIRNFRGIQELDLRLQPGLTLLVGRNNAGKSRILRALHVAMGGTQAVRDDLTVGSNSDARIDVVIAPLPSPSPNGESASPSSRELNGQVEEFNQSVSQRFGDSISLISDKPLRQRLAWRTIITPTSEETGARSQYHVMTTSLSEGWTTEPLTSLNREQHSLFVAELINTQRDLDQELKRPGSALRRILNDLNVPEDKREELKNRLAELGGDIVEQSDTLRELRKALETLDKYMDAMGTAKVNAVPGSLEELARTVGVSFDRGQGQVAARLQGSGVRSLASLQVQDLFYRLRLGSDGPDLRPHTVTLVEEPEAHLHPHAVFELPALLESQNRQVVAATHSPQLATVVDPKAIRLIRETPSEHVIIDFGPAVEDDDKAPRTKRPALYDLEIEKLKRLVERPFGDLLFARAIVIGDGATERAFLPPVLRDALSTLAHGVSVVDSAGMTSPYVEALIKFARHVDIPLLVLADDDPDGQRAVKNLVEESKLDCTEIVWMSTKATNGAIERMLIEFDLELCRRVCQQFVLPASNKKEVLKFMKSKKGSIGALLAEEFVKAHPYSGTGSHWPEPLSELVDKLQRQLNDGNKDI